MSADADWICQEFATVDFADARLNKRFLKSAIRFAAKPESSISLACSSRAERKGAYRMFSNPVLDSEEILEPHQMMTGLRLAEHNRVFAIQDTSFLEFSNHESTEGLGSIGNNGRSESLGLILHSGLAVTEQGYPLGLLSQQCWARPIKSSSSRAAQKKRVKARPIEEKESGKWLSALDDTAAFASKKCQIITLADREGDIFEFIAKANAAKSSFVVRNSFDRKTSEGRHLSEVLAATMSSGTHVIDLPGGRGRKAQKVTLEVRFVAVDIAPVVRVSSAKSSEIAYEAVKVFAVEAKQISPGKEPLHWTLLTSEPVTSFAEAVEKINWYKLRWSIEVFHKILKSGCRIEDCRLQHADKLKRYVCLMSIIAVRIFQITMSARSKPDAPCTSELTETQWRVLYMRVHKTKKFPTKTPTLKEAVGWIAELGGYQNRRTDPPPGIIVIWRGWQTLEECIAMWEAIASPEV